MECVVVVAVAELVVAAAFVVVAELVVVAALVVVGCLSEQCYCAEQTPTKFESLVLEYLEEQHLSTV